MNDSYSILIIEDEKNILDFMSRTLKANGYKTTTVTSGKAGLSIINFVNICYMVYFSSSIKYSYAFI